MGVECVKTCVIHASEMMANYDKARVIALLRESIDFERLSAIQFCPRGLIRITFKNASDKEDFARMGSLALDGHDLSVTSSDKPPSLVYVHYFPVEGDDALICDEIRKYGEVIGIKHQDFSGIPGLLTGSRILTMILSDPVPAEFRIDDYPVRVWYRGIPPFCQICKVNGHKAADCQFNGKCRKCGSPDHKAHASTRPWGQSGVPMEVAVPAVMPDPSETVVPAVSDSSVLDEGADEPVEDVDHEKDVAVVEEDVDAVEEVEVADKEDGEVVVEDGTPAGAPVLSVPVVECVQVPSGPVAVSGPSGPPQAACTRSDSSPVASCRIFTPELRRKFFEGYRAMLCRNSGNAAFVFSHKDFKLCGVSPADDPDRVRVTYENGAVSIVHANLIRMSRVDTSDEPSEVEFAQFILKVKDDPSYRISFRGSIIDAVGPTEHSNALWVEFTDHCGPQGRMLPVKALSVKNIAVKSNSSVNSVNKVPSFSAEANVNNVNKADDGFVNVSRGSSRSVVPTAAVLAAELLKRTTPPSVVGVPKCRKKL